MAGVSVVAAGMSPGIRTIDGGYTQTGAGVLQIELAGTTPGIGGYDQLNVVGPATLGGSLQVMPYGPTPPNSGTFNILVAGGASSGGGQHARGAGLRGGG